MLPYRATLTFPEVLDLNGLVRSRLESWITRKKNPSPRAKSLFLSGSMFDGHAHEINDSGATLRCFEMTGATDGVERYLYRFKEQTPIGHFVVDIMVGQPRSPRRREAGQLIVEVNAPDLNDDERPIDPPSFLREVLEEETAKDGNTPITSSPRLIHKDEISELLRYIEDQDRSVAVIVATAVSPEQPSTSNLLAAVRNLTDTVVGVATTFVVHFDAVEQLNSQLPDSHKVQLGSVRTFMPGVSLSDSTDGRRHRFLGPRTFARALGPNWRVARPLREAYAFQVRGRQLESPLPRNAARLRTLLLQAIGDAEAREAVRQEAPVLESPGKRPGLKSSKLLVQSILKVLAKWVGDPQELNEGSLPDELDRLFTVQQGEILHLRSSVETSQSTVQELSDRIAEIQEDFHYLELELAEERRDFQKSLRENRYLRERLADLNEFVAEGTTPRSIWDEDPNDLIELALLLSEDDFIKTYVEFVGDLDKVEEAARRELHPELVTRNLWSQVQVLWEYAYYKAQGQAQGNLHACLAHPDYAGSKVAPKSHAPGETDATATRFGDVRTFMLPDGREVLMGAHFKPSKTIRMHYYDDTGAKGTGKIYIGYIGTHLQNMRTKNM